MPSKLLQMCKIKEDECIIRSYQKGKLVDDNLCGERCAVQVLEGELTVSAVTADGKEVNLSSLGPGDIFGISNLFIDDELRTILQCKSDSTLMFIEKQLLRKRILSDYEAMAEYSRICNSKIQFLLSRIEQLSANTSRAKLSEYLLENNESRKMTREELASYLGISRAALYRELSRLQDAGCIETGGGCIKVLDEEKLRSLEHEG